MLLSTSVSDLREEVAHLKKQVAYQDNIIGLQMQKLKEISLVKDTFKTDNIRLEKENQELKSKLDIACRTLVFTNNELIEMIEVIRMDSNGI